jgi:hypothetical protein
MNISGLLTNAVKLGKAHLPEILTGIGAVGVAATAYLTGRASFRAARQLEDESPYLSTTDKAKKVWTHYIPPVVVGGVTVACIVCSSQASGRRTAAAVTAYSLSEKAFSQYKEKVVEQLGKNKEQQLRDDLAQERVAQNPVDSRNVLVTIGGDAPWCELYTMRYFRSDMETIRKAVNIINARINSDVYVSLDEFYELIGLPFTTQSPHVGWDSDKLLELEFSTAMTPDGKPCGTFDYNYVKPIR